MRNRFDFLWFCIGLGISLQFLASLSLTEAFVVGASIFVFPREIGHMRRTGANKLLWFALFLDVSCIASSLVNRVPFGFFLRGMSVCVIITSSIVVGHWLLRTRMNGYKWYFIGSAMSTVITTFAFRHAAEIGKSVEEISEGPLFWIGQLTSFFTAPSYGWYLHIPWQYSMIVPFFIAIFAVTTSVSGRSSALGLIGMSILVFIGRHKIAKMQLISRYFWVFMLVAFIGIFGINALYRHAAMSGWMGEASREKYIAQTRGGTGVVQLLISGRLESFVGFLACVDNPIFGLGPWAQDDENYYTEFVAKYGAQEDYDKLVRWKMNPLHDTGTMAWNMIPVHSMITQFWCWFGLGGLVFVIMTIWVFIRYLKHDVAAVPQWFFWIACTLPARFWDIGFSPFSRRVGIPLMLVACCIADAVRRKKIALNQVAQEEIIKAQRKR